MKADRPVEVLVITGMSGAGKTQVVNFWRDLGYFCIDNFAAYLSLNLWRASF